MEPQEIKEFMEEALYSIKELAEQGEKDCSEALTECAAMADWYLEKLSEIED